MAGEAVEFIYESEEQKIGLYSDIARATFSAWTFGFDFAQAVISEEGGTAGVRVLVRIVTSPQHAKALRDHLSARVAAYEEQFGEIRLPEEG